VCGGGVSRPKRTKNIVAKVKMSVEELEGKVKEIKAEADQLH
jgi:hypothetical protein